MNTTVINIKINPVVKKQAQRVASELGFSLSALIKAYLKQIIKTKTVTFSASSEEPTEYLLETLKESGEDIKRGGVISFKKPKSALDYVDRLIEREKRQGEN